MSYWKIRPGELLNLHFKRRKLSDLVNKAQQVVCGNTIPFSTVLNACLTFTLSGIKLLSQATKCVNSSPTLVKYGL